MEMIKIKNTDMRRRLCAVAILLSMSTTPVHAAEPETDSDLPAQIVEVDEEAQTAELIKILDGDDFTDEELAALKDILQSLNDQNFFERTIDAIGGKFINAIPFTSEEPSTIGLNLRGENNIFIQRDDILLTGDNSVGVNIGGVENRFILTKNATITADGLGGKGILIYGGRGHLLNIGGKIFAAGNAIEFNADSLDEDGEPLVNDLNLSGQIHGNEHAIFIGKNSFVRNINLNAGAEIIGDIESISDSTTDFNFNAPITYGGKIFGNINLHINDTLKFSGAAEVVGVEIVNGAELFGGTFTTKNFINHGTIGALSPEENLVINGNLISDGFLKKISGGSAGLIIVHGNANIDGSTVTTDSLLPNETAIVLFADSISGKIKNPTGNPVPISAMLNATGSVIGGKLFVTTSEADNLGKMNSQEQKTLTAMKDMFSTLDDDKQNQMRDLYNLEPPAAKETLTQISSNDSAQVMSVAQQNTVVDKMIATRVTQVFAPSYVDLNVNPMNFADGDDGVNFKVKVPTRQENNFWLNGMKNWGNLRGGTDYHGSVIIGGYDRSFGDKWRAGIFATYGTIGYGADSSRATVYDTRFGIYGGYHNRASDVYLYVNGGQLRNSLHRGLSSLGLTTNANYRSRIIEFGGEYKYDLQPRRKWHVSPFVNVQTSHLRQNSYNEHGAGIYNQHVDAHNNTYFAAQVGLDLKRYYRAGMFGLRLGVKHGFTGVDPDLNISYEGDGGRSYRLRQQRDKTHFVFSVRGENEFARGWFAGGEAEVQLGENDKDITASLMLRRTW